MIPIFSLLATAGYILVDLVNQYPNLVFAMAPDGLISVTPQFCPLIQMLENCGTTQ
jgi:hypothetical protein